MPITIAAEDDAAHKSHVISRLALNFDLRVLRHVRAHLIDKQIGKDKLFDSAAPCCEALLAEIIREQ